MDYLLWADKGPLALVSAKLSDMYESRNARKLNVEHAGIQGTLFQWGNTKGPVLDKRGRVSRSLAEQRRPESCGRIDSYIIVTLTKQQSTSSLYALHGMA